MAYAGNEACEEARTRITEMDLHTIPGVGWISDPGRRGGVTGQDALFSGLGEMGELQDLDGTSKVVIHDDDRLISLMDKVLDAQPTLAEVLML